MNVGTLLRTNSGKPFAQFTIGPYKKRAGAVLEHVDGELAAMKKKEVIGAFVDRLRDAGHTRCLRNLIREACAADAEGLERVRKLAQRILAGKEAGLAGGGAVAKEGVTVEQLAELWTNGALAERHPDHVRVRKHADREEALFGVLNAIRMPDGARFGAVAIAAVTLDDLDHVMANLPKSARSALTRRNYARAIGRLLSLAVFPLRLRASTPIPPGWTPKGRSNKAKAWIYPAEDLAVMQFTEIPIVRRLLWGVLGREGMRASEALGLTWLDLDLEHGIVRLDENKTDEPRSWALGADVAAALAAWKKIRGAKAKKNPKVFPLSIIGWQGSADARHLAELLREDLLRAGVERSELHKSTTPNRLRLRAHDLRGTFVTLALAAGKSEAWVTDCTGHKSSTMIYTYKRASRTAAELNLGWFEPLDEAIPELADADGNEPRGRANAEQTRVPRGREMPQRGSNSPRKRHLASGRKTSSPFENRRGCKPSKSSNLFSSAMKLEEFRAALSSIPPSERDAWLDAFFGLDHLPIDAELPRGCVPYMPCSVDVLLRAVEHANVQEPDVFVDIGSGVGRAAIFVQLLTGASVIGVEIQSKLVHASRELAARVNVTRFSVVEGDAPELASAMTSGTVFFLYCPFSGDRLEKVLADLEAIARTKEIRICCVDLPLPPRSWLTLVSPPSRDLAVYRSTFSVERSIHGA